MESSNLLFQIGLALAVASFGGAAWLTRNRLPGGTQRSIVGVLLAAVGIYGGIAVVSALVQGDLAGSVGTGIGVGLAEFGGVLALALPLLVTAIGVSRFLDAPLAPHAGVMLAALFLASGIGVAVALATDNQAVAVHGIAGGVVADTLVRFLGSVGAWVAVSAWIGIHGVLLFPGDPGVAAKKFVLRIGAGGSLVYRGVAAALSWLGSLYGPVVGAVQSFRGHKAKKKRRKTKKKGPKIRHTAPATATVVDEKPDVEPTEPTPDEPPPPSKRKLRITDVADITDVAVPPRVASRQIAVEDYKLPPLNLLEEPAEDEVYRPSRDELITHADALEQKLADFGIRGEVREVSPGPVITRFEVVPAPGVKINRIAALADDLAMSLKASRVRILAPIPGKDAVGVEVPNRQASVVRLREILASDSFADPSLNLPIAVGKTIDGDAYAFDLTRTPHLLIAGATGSGKSVCINSIIASLLYQATPEDLRLLLVDPKMLELSVYNGIPHLIAPVITNPKDVAKALQWAVAEMETRYQKLAEHGVRSIASYNRRVSAILEQEGDGDDILPGEEHLYGDDEEEQLATLPYIVIIIDELADLMLTVANEIEEPIARLAQKARAVGIHLILATQRPSVNVITGVIKANFPSRIAFQVASKTDSRTILDANGAEKLLGRGDMLYMEAGAPNLERVHGAFLSDGEVKRVADFISAQGMATERIDFREEGSDIFDLPVERDALYEEALRIIVTHQQGSASLLQRRLKVGYARASRLIDELEASGIVGPFEGSKSREVLVTSEYLEEIGLVKPEGEGTR